ncbi:MAG: hypothetical protein ACFFAO_07695, partial [Candidatus Hermodarchaeota archaeon]
MFRNRKKIRSIFLVSILVTLILISNLSQSSININALNPNNENSFNDDKNYENLPSAAAYEYTDDIIGVGADQDVRAYLNRIDRLTGISDGSIEIGITDPNTYLSSGEYILEFQDYITANYTVEDDSALEPAGGTYYREYNFRNEPYTYIDVHSGTIESPDDDFGDLIDTSYNTYMNISTDDGTTDPINFTICADYTDMQSGGDTFNKEDIIGFVSILNYTLSQNYGTYLTVQMRDFEDAEWDTIVNNANGSLNEDFYNLIINENIRYVNDSDCTLIRFILNRLDNEPFYVYLRTFQLDAIVVAELPISNDNWLALEFDLRGESSDINGFYVWIRALDLSIAKYAVLNITIYKANGSMYVDKDTTEGKTNLKDDETTTRIAPDLSQPVYTENISGYVNDDWQYFDIPDQVGQSRGNYFIMIKSNTTTSQNVYSLVCLTSNIYGDGNDKIDHQIKVSIDNGNTWNLDTISYDAYLDAHKFQLNVTRNYIPADFEVDGERTLRFDNEELIEDYKKVLGNEPHQEWGLGLWNNSFVNPIASSSSQFQIILDWDPTNIASFTFDLNYSAYCYSLEPETDIDTEYRANYNSDTVRWTFNYSFDPSGYDSNWDFTEFHFVYPQYFSVLNLTHPDGSEILPLTGGEEVDDYKSLYSKTVVSEEDLTVTSGIYSLNLTSPNAIDQNDIYSYINYEGILWESQGFMYGDNISISLDVNTYYGFYLTGGTANVSFYYPDDTLIVFKDNSNGVLSKDRNTLSYDFNNETIFDVTPASATQLGTYNMGYFWSNGSIVGANRIPIYIDTYQINITSVEYDHKLKKNLLFGETDNAPINDYSLLIASINETTLPADFYSVNNSLSRDEATYTYTLDYNPKHPLNVYLQNFMQTETILNPEEQINFKLTIQNLDNDFDLDVRVKVALVCYQNDEWIINDTTSVTKNLSKNGQSGDTQEYSLDVTMPALESNNIWKGKNAPIRQGGAKTLVSIYIKHPYNSKYNLAGTYVSNITSLTTYNKSSEFDGYILALKDVASAKPVITEFERDECIYLPDFSNFYANVIDVNYLSTYMHINFTKGLRLAGKFTNIKITPENPIEGKTFKVSTLLSTEFDDQISNKRVTVEYYDGDSWINVTSGITNINGSIIFTLSSGSTFYDFENSKLFRLVYAGDSEYLNATQQFSVEINIQTNKISLSSEEDEEMLYMYRNTDKLIEITIKNTGTSILKIIDIDVEIDENLKNEVVKEDSALLDYFTAGESTTIVIKIKGSDIDADEIRFRVEITAQNLISGEIIIERETIRLDVIDKPLFDYLFEYFIYESNGNLTDSGINLLSLVILALILLTWLVAYSYRKKAKKRIEIPIKKVKEEERPRKGRYVKVAELKAESK